MARIPTLTGGRKPGYEQTFAMEQAVRRKLIAAGDYVDLNDHEVAVAINLARREAIRWMKSNERTRNARMLARAAQADPELSAKVKELAEKLGITL